LYILTTIAAERIAEHPHTICSSVLARAGVKLPNNSWRGEEDGSRISYKVLSVFEIIETDLNKVEARTRYMLLDDVGYYL